jgi:hypothetical protein
MSIYRLVPIAAPGDPNWDRALNQGEVVVRAGSAGEARAVAAIAEAAAAVGREPELTTQVGHSALMDDKLYAVREEEIGQYPAEGPPEVLSAAFRFPEGYTMHDD